MARLSDGSGAARFALKSLQSIALCGAVISALNSLIGGEYLHSKVRQKSTGNTFACTLALYHIESCLSIFREHMFVILELKSDKIYYLVDIIK